MAKIGSLTVDLSLNSATFIRDLSRSSQATATNTARMQASLQRLQSQVAGVETLGKRLAGVFGGWAAGRQLLRAAQQSAALGESITNLSKAAGLTTDQFQAFTLSAAQSGSSSEEAAGAIDKFAKAVGQAREGSGALASALKDTNPALLAQIRNADSTAEAMELFARAFVQVDNASDAAALRAAAFGRTSKTLEPTLRALAGGFSDLAQQQREFIITPEQLRSLGEMDDIFDRIGLTLQIGFAQGMANAAKETGDLNDELSGLRSISEFFGNEFSLIVQNIAGLGTQAHGVRQALLDFTARPPEERTFLTWLEDLGTAAFRAVGAIDSARRAKAQLASSGGLPALPTHESFLSEWEGVGEDGNTPDAGPVNEYADALLRARMETVEFWNATSETTAAGQELIEANEKQLAIIQQMLTPMEQYRQAIEKINEAQLDASHRSRAMAQAQSELIGTYLDGVQQATGALASAFRENKAIQIANAVVNTAAGITKALGDPKLPFPLDFAVAASIAAAGAAQIAAISSAQPGSGRAPRVKGGGGAGARGGGGRGGGGEGEGGGAQGPQRAITISLQGSGPWGRESIRELVAGINEYTKDGGVLLTTT